MKFGQMLAVGRSLIGISDNSNRYRMPKRNWLPRFLLLGNPFRRAAAASTDENTADESLRDKGDTASQGPGTLPGKDAGPGTVQQPAAGNPAGGRNRLVGEGQASVLKPAQGELSLQQVTVVRNDFSDFDAETEPLLARLRGGGTAAVLPRRTESVATRAIGRLQAALQASSGNVRVR